MSAPDPPLVSINIPCYRQLPLARRAVESVLAQSLSNFELTLLDDGASEEYREYVASLGDPRVRYQRNPTRLGAMQNMFAAIQSGRGSYTLAFHEDDLLGRHYLEAAVGILEANPGCGFVAGQLREFETEPSAEAVNHEWDGRSVDHCPTGADYLRAIFSGVEPMFGSIVYRRAALAGVSPDHDRFATLVDRPFLLTILQNWSAAIIRAPLVWYRHHGEGDARHHALTVDHILHFFARYRAAFPEHWSAEDQSRFFAYSGAWLFELFKLIPPAKRPGLPGFLYHAWRRGIYRPTLRGHHGLWHVSRRRLRGQEG